MVSLNLTLLIELALFLIFLWGTARFVLRPVLKILDEREAGIEDDLTRCAEEIERAEERERNYARELSDLRRHAEETYREAKRDTLKAHIEAVANAHEWADQAVAEAREQAADLLAEQRGAMRDAVPEIADLIAGRLDSRGPS